MPASDRLAPERAEELIGLPSGEFESAVAELVAAGADGVPLLQRLEELAANKRAHKVVRRALHRLKSRGVAVEAPRLRGRSVLRPVEGEPEQGLVTPIDPLGRRVAFLLVPVRGGAELYEIALSDADGVLAVRHRRGRRREARGFVRDLSREQGSRAVLVPGAEVRALVLRCEAQRSGPPASEVDPRTLTALAAGAGDRTPGERVAEKLRSAAREEPDAWADSVIGRRAEAGQLGPWLLTAEGLEQLARGLAEIERSPLVLSDLQKTERRNERIAASAPGLFDAATRETFAARLEETAVFLLEAGDEEGARAAVQLAGRVREAEQPLRVDFLRRSLERSLQLTQQRLQAEESGKLVVPG